MRTSFAALNTDFTVQTCRAYAAPALLGQTFINITLETARRRKDRREHNFTYLQKSPFIEHEAFGNFFRIRKLRVKVRNK